MNTDGVKWTKQGVPTSGYIKTAESIHFQHHGQFDCAHLADSGRYKTLPKVAPCSSHTVSSPRMERKPGLRDRITPAEYVHYKPTTTTSTAAAASQRRGTLMTGDYDWKDNVPATFPTKTNEKETLHGLNDRFASFIEKVRHLEHQNELLQREIEDIRQKEQSPASLQQTFGPELEDLRRLLRGITHQKHRIEVEHQTLEQDLIDLRDKYDTEASVRADAETNIVLLKRDIDDACRAKLELDKKSQAISAEIDALKRDHDSEVSQLIAQLHRAQEGASVRASEFGCPELTAALRDVRAQLEDHAASDLHKAEESYHVQVSKLTEAAETKRDALKASKLEIQEYRKRLQSKSVELDCVKGTREALERQLREIEECHNEEIIHYQVKYIFRAFRNLNVNRPIIPVIGYVFLNEKVFLLYILL